MKVIQEGDITKLSDAYRFDCDKCGCVWIASAAEYVARYGFDKKYLVCKCPTCNYGVRLVLPA